MAAGPRPARPLQPPPRSVHQGRPSPARPDSKPAQPPPAKDDAHSPGGFGPLPREARRLLPGGDMLADRTSPGQAMRKRKSGPALRRNVRAAGATGRVVAGSVEPPQWHL